MFRVGQDRIITPYITVYLVTLLPKVPYVHTPYVYMAIALLKTPNIYRVGQNCVSAPYMIVCMVIHCQKYCMYTVYTYKSMVLTNPTNTHCVYTDVVLANPKCAGTVNAHTHTHHTHTGCV